MIEIKSTWVGGIEGAIRGMRNPYESHSKSDSNFDTSDTLAKRLRDAMDEKGLTQLDVANSLINPDTGKPLNPHTVSNWFNGSAIRRRRNAIISQLAKILDKSEDYFDVPDWGIGEADMALCRRLIKAGTEHRKFLRMIHVQADVLAPRYWWAEMDKYKFVEANSSSTMHLITRSDISIDDFSIDYNPETCLPYEILRNHVQDLIEAINDYKRDKEEGCDKYILDSDFRIIKQLIPESYNQLRTIDTNYECLLSIYHQRRNHRLSEWNTFREWIESLPYMKEFINACS